MSNKSNANGWGMVLAGIGVLIVLSAISRQSWCGANCKTLVSDAEGTLVQKLLTGLFG